MAKVGCRIYTKVDRPEPELVRRFEDYAAADLDDCMGRIASMDCGIKPFNGVKLLGTAVTVNLPSGTNLMFHQALSLAQEGDVIVVNAGGDTSRGVCGENMIEIAKERGVRGFVVDGVCDTLKHYNTILFAEDTVRTGGIGEQLGFAMQQCGWQGEFLLHAVDNSHLLHANVPELRKDQQLDAAALCADILNALKEKQA